MSDEVQLEAIVRHLGEAIWMLDVDVTKTLYVNPAFEKVFGISAAAMQADPRAWFKLVLEEDRPLIDFGVHQALSEEGMTKEFRIRRPDGAVRWIRSRVFPVRDASGRVARITGTSVDITERRGMEEQLKRLSSAVEQSPVSVLITDAAGNIEYVNSGFCRITGYAREEALGKHARLLKSGDTPPETYQALWKTILSGREWLGELCNRRKDGSLCWVRASISPIRGADGSITHFMGIEEDITEHRELEGHYHQAQKMESVGRLAGGVAHDFNNILTAILGYAQLALKGVEPESSTAADLVEIEAAARRAASVVRQLLAFSRREIMRPLPIDLNVLVGDLSRMLRRLIGEDIELTTVLSPGLGGTKADPGLIEQVLVNLTVNARDAMPEGGKLVIETANAALDAEFVRRHPGAAAGEFVMLAVTDSGSGMDAQTQAHLFEPYFTTKERGKGTGLGLATCYGIVKQHGGTIWVYSEPGRGTCFKVYLPRTGERAAGPVQASPDREVPGGPETVLVAEDEATVRSMIARSLRRLGYKVLEGANGEEALRAAQAHPGAIDLLLTDVVMPLMGGRELAGRLSGLRPRLRTLFMSGYTDDSIVRMGVLEGQMAFLQKPVMIEVLARKVREVLDK